jgi:hypothetical protein
MAPLEHDALLRRHRDTGGLAYLADRLVRHPPIRAVTRSTSAASSVSVRRGASVARMEALSGIPKALLSRPENNHGRPVGWTFLRLRRPGPNSSTMSIARRMTYTASENWAVRPGVASRTNNSHGNPEQPVSVHHVFSDCPNGEQIDPTNWASGTGGLPNCGTCESMGG